jgi:hypothetical protein
MESERGTEDEDEDEDEGEGGSTTTAVNLKLKLFSCDSSFGEEEERFGVDDVASALGTPSTAIEEEDEEEGEGESPIILCWAAEAELRRAEEEERFSEEDFELEWSLTCSFRLRSDRTVFSSSGPSTGEVRRD